MTIPTSEYNQVFALAQTIDGALWAGTFGFGLSRFDGSSWRTYTTRDGLPSNYITSLAVTPNGELWVDTLHLSSLEGEFGRFDGKKWIPEAGGLFFSIVASPDGSLWGVWNGIPFSSIIDRFDGVKWEHKRQFQIYDLVTALTVAPDGEVWVATKKSVFRSKNGIWREIKPPWEETAPDVTAIAVTQKGVAWFAFSFRTPDDLVDKCGYRSEFHKEIGVYSYDGKSWTHFTDQDGLVDNKICAITGDPDGSIWFGSYDKGVSHYDGHTWSNYVLH